MVIISPPVTDIDQELQLRVMGYGGGFDSGAGEGDQRTDISP